MNAPTETLSLESEETARSVTSGGVGSSALLGFVSGHKQDMKTMKTKEQELQEMEMPYDTKLAVRLWWASILLSELEEEIRLICRVDGHTILQEPDAIDTLTGHESKNVFKALRAVSQRLERAAPTLAHSISEMPNVNMSQPPSGVMRDDS